MKYLISYFTSLMMSVCLFYFQSLVRKVNWPCMLIAIFFVIRLTVADAQVIVASGGNVNMCVGGSFVSIPDIKISEKNKTDFAPSSNVQTYELNAPLNFEFNPGIGAVVIPTSTDISFADLNITATKITLNYLLNTTVQKDSFIFRDIQVHAINVPSSSDLLFTGGTASQNQNNKKQYVHAHFNSNQANVDLTSVQKVVCMNASDIILNGSPSGGNYTASPSTTGLTGNIFKPGISGLGLFIITYTATQNGCVGSDTVHITVKPIPTVTFTGLMNSYCSNDADVTLTGSPSGGVFSGNGISSNSFKPNTLVAGITSVTYSYTNSTGCSNRYTQSGINILQAPLVTISLSPDQSIYPTTSASVLITGTQTNPSAGGTITLSGNGVSNITNMFYPSVAGVGTFDIIRTLVAPNGCIAKATKTVTVASSVGLYINGLLPKYCVGDGVSQLSSVGGIGKFMGPGLTDVNPVNGTAKFSPDGIVFAGQDTIITIYCDYSDRTIMVLQSVKISNRPTLSIQQDTRVNATGFRVDFCRNDAIVQLKTAVSPIGGALTYSGTGVEFISSGYMFNPQIASSVNAITVKYTDLNGCVNTDSKIANVNAMPDPYFTISSYCEGDVIHLKDSSSIVLGNGINDVIDLWQWRVDNTVYNNQNIDLTIPAGNHTIKYTLTTKAGCVGSLQKSVFIGPYPIISFSWDKVCNEDVTKFSNATAIPNGTGWIDTLKWSFVGIKDTIFKAANQNPSPNYWDYTYKFLNPGVYKVIQTAITNSHCRSIDSQKVFIFPVINVGINTPYANDFQSGQGGWISSTAADTSSSWAWGFVNKSIIKSLSNNDFVWATNLSGSYKVNEHSYVYSPCFILDDLDRPMIHMDIWSATQLQIAGANLQYTTDGIHWETLGKTNESGINWYNNIGNINSRPAGSIALNQDGWTGVYSGWKNVRHVFDRELGRNKNIRFRLSFAGANGSTTDGFAFDNVWIGNRTKLMLAEHFTNNSSLYTKKENTTLNNLITTNLLNNEPKDIVKLEYHTAFPGPDQMNARNIPDAGARSLYYGITQIPYTCVDGSYFKGSALQIDTNMINTRSLYDPAFNITLNPNLNSNNVSGSVTIENKIPVSNTVTVYISLLERFVNNIPGTNGETSYQWVHAKFLPDAAGTSFESNWSTQSSQTIDFNWDFTSANLYDPNKLAMIVFVQNNATKEIYQTAYKGLGATVATGVFNPAEKTSTVSLYPNPANDFTTVILNGKLSGEYNWVITDELGRTVGQGGLENETDSFVINTASYANGFYTLRLSNAADGVKTQKFVVVH